MHRLKTTAIFALLALAATALTGLSPAPGGADTDASGDHDAAALAAPSIHDALPARQGALAATATAIDRATVAGLGTQQPVDEPLDYRAILEGIPVADGARSLGTTNRGSMHDAVAMEPVGDHHEILPQHRRRNTNWGTPELVDALTQAANHVGHELGGAGLRIGNIGFRRGGRLPWSSSHQAGRDADIAFYALDDAGRSVPTPRFVEFDDDGKAVDAPLYFDVQRNWALVRDLLTNPDIYVQWLFISEGLKFQLLEHAATIDEPRELIKRASRVLHQPTNAAPHADHFHLRIGCSRADRLSGCVDRAPLWEWHDWHRDALFARSRELQRAFDSDDPDIRIQALETLHELQSPYAADLALLHGIGDSDSEARNVAMNIVDDIDLESDVGLRALGDALEHDIDGEHSEVLYGALTRSNAPSTTRLAMQRFADANEPDERSLALRAVRHRMEPELVAELSDALRNEPTPELRADIVTQIRRITASSFGLDWTDSELNDEHHRALARWEQRAQQLDSNRQRALLDMLAEYDIDAWDDLDAVDDLIPLLRHDADYKRYNVNLLLSEWTGRWVPREWGSGRSAYEFWSDWWDEHRDQRIRAASAVWTP